MRSQQDNVARELKSAKSLFGTLSRQAVTALKKLVAEDGFSVAAGDLIYFGNGWYITHAGLLRLAQRRHCSGIHSQLLASSDSTNCRWLFKATVYKSRSCRGFVGYGDADPSNVSPVVRGAEMRVAETRAVNRALRKAYGVACSVEEIGSSIPSSAEKLPPQNVNGSSPTVRNRLCELIRRHRLDAELVKFAALDFCGTKTLREATREQVENFVRQLADWAEKDRNALVGRLDGYARPKQEVVA